jgi:vitamin B12 transporter
VSLAGSIAIMKITLLKSAAPLALVVACPAFAQTAQNSGGAESGPEAITVDHMSDEFTLTVIGARENIPDVGASVSILNRDALALRQDVSVADALTRLPGIAASRNGGPGGFTGLRIRGADAAQTLVVINGVRVGDPSSPGGGFDFGNLLSDGIERIDILRGSNSIAWGSDAIGGVVLIDTLSVAGNSLRATTEGGSFGTARGAVDASYATGPLNLSVGGGYFTTDGVSAARSGTEADGYRRWSAHGATSLAATDSLTWTNALYYSHGRVEIDGFAPPTFSFGDTPQLSTIQEVYARSGLNWRNNAVTQTLDVSLADINRDNFNSPTATTASFIARGRSERVAYQIDWSAEPVRVVAGADYEWSRLFTTDGFSPDSQTVGIGGGYGQIVVSPSDQWQISGGVRHNDHRRFGGATVFSGNLVWQSGSGLAARLAYSEGFKAPTLFQLSGSASAFGNPALQPERSQNYEAGLRYRGDSWHVDAAVFRRDSGNLIDFVGCTGAGAPAICASGNRPFGTYANIAKAQSEGIDVAADGRFGDLTLAASYSHVSSHDRTTGRANSGRRLARRPQDTASVSIDWRTQAGVGIGGDVRYVGPSFDNASNSVRLAGFALVSLRASVDLNKQFELFGRVDNLFDATYQTVANYGTLGRGFSIGVRAKL